MVNRWFALEINLMLLGRELLTMLFHGKHTHCGRVWSLAAARQAYVANIVSEGNRIHLNGARRLLLLNDFFILRYLFLRSGVGHIKIRNVQFWGLFQMNCHSQDRQICLKYFVYFILI